MEFGSDTFGSALLCFGHVTLSRQLALQASAFDHSAIHPYDPFSIKRRIPSASSFASFDSQASRLSI